MTAAQLTAELQQSRAALFEHLRGLSEEQFRFVPAGETWSIATYLGHLLRIERLFTERASRALVEEEPHIASTGTTNEDEPGLAQHLAVPQIVHGLLNARRDLESLLERCDEAGFGRGFVHERFGRMSVLDAVIKLRDHEREHERDVARLVRQAPASARVILPLMQRS